MLSQRLLGCMPRIVRARARARVCVCVCVCVCDLCPTPAYARWPHNARLSHVSHACAMSRTPVLCHARLSCVTHMCLARSACPEDGGVGAFLPCQASLPCLQRLSPWIPGLRRRVFLPARALRPWMFVCAPC